LNRLWLDDFKIALLNEDLKLIEELTKSMPHFTQRDELLEAKALVDEAIKSFIKDKNNISAQMKTIKKNIEFLHTKESDHFQIDI
jgi:hypothetical protein